MAHPSFDLVVLAAGLGSRFGGVKQTQPVGPHGELIIEYSVFDALRAGFGRVVLVIRRDIEADFRATIGRRLEARVDVRYVFQEPPAPVQAGPRVPDSAPVRRKPWGTGHAVLTARDAVRGPFAVVNADDFYGASGYTAVARHLAATAGAARPAYALVGYPLGQTLSAHGTVSRGVCSTDANGRLLRITELTQVERTAEGASYADARGVRHQLNGAEPVSMNFWGLTPAIFPQLENLFGDFIARHTADPAAEFFLPTAVSMLNERQVADVALLRSSDPWFGLTYREDLAAAQAAVRGLVAAGRYPSPLWGWDTSRNPVPS